jgi:Putative DNA-binding domain
MIPKPLNEITWSDIEALKTDEREEDDMLEYKQAFSVEENGEETLHYDYGALNKNQKKKANASIAKHAIAFLNGRGGDLILGVREQSKENPVIAEFTPIRDIVDTRDRLERALAEVIEPHQTALSIKAITSPDNEAIGVLVVRANSSLRAPHRSTISKNCYVRRGRESVPMPMDEVQDLTLRRDFSRSELFKRLDQRIANYHSMLGHVLMGSHVHISFGLVSYQNSDIIIDDRILREIDSYVVQLKNASGEIENTSYDGFSRQIWKPMPRGHFVKYYHQFDSNGRPSFRYKQQEIHRDGTLIMHLAESGITRSENPNSLPCIDPEDFVHKMADALGFFRNAFGLFPTLLPAAFRVKISVIGQIDFNPNREYRNKIIEGEFTLPDWEIQSAVDFSKIYQNIRTDIYNAASIHPPGLSELV